MRSKLLNAALLCLGATVCSSGLAQDHVVSQKDRQFKPQTMTVKVGESVIFLNDDIVRHNVFSLSKALSFDLGTFPPGQSRKIVPVKVGVIDIECALHPNMRLRIKVVK
jgi:plastocyanin